MQRSSLILVINISVLVVVILVGLAIQIAPYFTCSILGICAVTILYILTEQWMTHDAIEFQNRFWTLMAFVFALSCLFCSDSPMKLVDREPTVAWVIVVVFAFLAHNYDRHLHRLVLKRSSNIRRIKSTDFCSAESRSNAHEKVLALRKLISTIDHTWMSSTFLNFFFLYKVLYVEHQIIAIITEADANELNLIVNNVELGLLFYKVKDHKIARRFNRTNLLTLLAIDRISELVVPSRAALLDGLQRMKLSAHPQSEKYVLNIITNTKGDELSELKTLTDNKGDVNSMHKLIYTDIRSPSIKESILKYIAHEASVQRAHSEIGSKKGKRRGLLAWRKVLSDVDDTMTCAGGSWPAGMDTSYPKKAVYPGVLAFYRELDLGTVGSDEWDSSTRPGNLAFLSARPHVYKSVSENVTYDKFRKLQKERCLYTSPTLLAGSLDTGSQFMVKGNPEPLALNKFENFREYLALYPEYTCIFIGDNGQGDVRTAELVLKDKEFAKNLHRVYVHAIQPRHLTYCKNPVSTLADSRLYYFGTYVDAALDAFKHKLIRASGLRKIMEEACEDFLYIPLSSWLPHAASMQPSGITGSLHSMNGSSNNGSGNGASRGRSPSISSTEGGPNSCNSIPNSPNVSTSSARKHLPSSPAAASSNGRGLPQSSPGILVTGSVSTVSAGEFPSSTGGSMVEAVSSNASKVLLRRHSGGKEFSGASSIGGGGPSVSGVSSAASISGAHSNAGSQSSLGGGSVSSRTESPSMQMLARTWGGGSAKHLSSHFNAKKLRTGALEGELMLTPASMGYCRGGGIVRTFSNAATDMVNAERKRELRMREINKDIDRGNVELQKLGMELVNLLEFPCRYNVGTSVSTIFGEGIVTNFRSWDGIYEIVIGWDSKEEDDDFEVFGNRESSIGASRIANVGIAGNVLGSTPNNDLVEECSANKEDNSSTTSNPVPFDLHFSADSGSNCRRARSTIKMYLSGVAIHT
jgi:hypothetical protein